MKRRTIFTFFCLVFALPAFCASPPSHAGLVEAAPNSSIELTVGQSKVLRFSEIQRAAIGNPAVADIAVLSRNEVLLNAKAPGETLCYIQGKKESHSITVSVEAATPNADSLAASVSDALRGTGVTARAVGGAVVLGGEVESSDREQKVLAVAKAIAPNAQSLVTVAKQPGITRETLSRLLKPLDVTARITEEGLIVLEGAVPKADFATVKGIVAQLGPDVRVMNLVTDDAPERQLIIHARVVDVDQSALRDLGFDWGKLTYDDKGKVIGVEQPVIFGESRAPVDLDNGGPIRRLSDLGATLTALEQGNRAKILSAPDVVVTDRAAANIVVGGEIPVPVPQLGGGQNVIVIEYKEYGIKLAVTPRIMKDESISMHVQPEVSTLDYANAISLNGFSIPTLRTRRADTEVTVASGQTLVIGGLLQDANADTIRKIPFLADLPLFGELFKFRSRTRVRTQLVILVTPEILPRGVRPPEPALAKVGPEPVTLKPLLPGVPPKANEPPAMPDIPEPGATPIPRATPAPAAGPGA